MLQTQVLVSAEGDTQAIVKYSRAIVNLRNKILSNQKIDADWSTLDNDLQDFITWQIKTDRDKKKRLEDIIGQVLSDAGTDIDRYKRTQDGIKTIFVSEDQDNGLFDEFRIDGAYYRIKSTKSLTEKILTLGPLHRQLTDYEGITFIVRHKDTPYLDFDKLAREKSTSSIKDFIDKNAANVPIKSWVDSGFNYNLIFKSGNPFDFNEVLMQFLGAYQKIYGKRNEEACYKFAKKLEGVAESKDWDVEDLYKPTIRIFKTSLNPKTWLTLPFKAHLTSQRLTDNLSGNSIDTYVIACPSNEDAKWLLDRISKRKSSIDGQLDIDTRIKQNFVYIQLSSKGMDPRDKQHYLSRFENINLNFVDKTEVNKLTCITTDMIDGWSYFNIPIDFKRLGNLIGVFYKRRFGSQLKAQNYVEGNQSVEHQQRGYKGIHYAIKIKDDRLEFMVRDHEMELSHQFGKKEKPGVNHGAYKEMRWESYVERQREELLKRFSDPTISAIINRLTRFKSRLYGEQLNIKYGLLVKNLKEAFDPTIDDLEMRLETVQIIYGNILNDKSIERADLDKNLRSEFYKIFNSLSLIPNSEKGPRINRLRAATFLLRTQYPSLFNNLNEDKEFITKINETFLKSYVSICMYLAGQKDKPSDDSRLAGYGSLLLYEQYKLSVKDYIKEPQFNKLTARLLRYFRTGEFTRLEEEIKDRFRRTTDISEFNHDFENVVLPILRHNGANDIITQMVYRSLRMVFDEVKK